MREYKKRGNVQAKAYYTDRFWVAPQIPKEDVSTDTIFNNDLIELKKEFEILDSFIQRGQMVVYINSKDNFKVIKFLKEKLEYTILTELSALDYLEQCGEFEIFYQMLSMNKRKRLRVKCRIKENEPIQSIEPLFRSADWSEREMYDMFGILLNNHPYPKRILMPDDWHGHPLKKSYPLQGDVEAQWYEIDKIFGKEYRDIIGPEIRDSAHIDRYDTKRFARLGKEVAYGEDANSETAGSITKLNDDTSLVEKFDLNNAEIVDRKK